MFLFFYFYLIYIIFIASLSLKFCLLVDKEASCLNTCGTVAI